MLTIDINIDIEDLKRGNTSPELWRNEHESSGLHQLGTPCQINYLFEVQKRGRDEFTD